MDQVLVSGIAGGIAGIVVDLIYFPLDTLKTRIQASNNKVDYRLNASSVSKYKGLLSQMLISFPAAFIFFYSYDQGKVWTSKTNFSLPIQHMLSATLGECITNICRNPFEVIKNQMQVGLDPTIRKTIQSILTSQGIKGFYAGFPSILMREIPFSSIQFPIYETLKRNCKKDDRQLNWIDNIINGGTAGGIAAFLTTPCDVVKSKLMTQRGQYYESIGDCVQKVYKEEGFRGFFRASHYRTMQIASSGIIFFGAYEKATSILQQKIVKE